MCNDEIYRRASGRRHYNSVRHFKAEQRRRRLVKMLSSRKYEFILEHGTQARLARALNVSKSTICRDTQAILKKMQEHHPCPLCGAVNDGY